MSDFQNRLGHDDFVWWIGVVEDRFDPLNLGRCRVRIFGSHTENLQLVPTSSLPWATPLYPVNDSRTISTPMEGDYVFGFFMDGLSSQAPAMLGVFPGIPQEDVNAVTGKGFHAKAKLTNAPVGFGGEEFLANTHLLFQREHLQWPLLEKVNRQHQSWLAQL
jgi:hypothetical protein